MDNFSKQTVVWNNLGEMIHVLRRRRGWSQEELARRASVNAGYISKLECGHADPMIDTLEKITEALGYTISFHLVEQKQKPAEQLAQEAEATPGRMETAA